MLIQEQGISVKVLIISDNNVTGFKFLDIIRVLTVFSIRDIGRGYHIDPVTYQAHFISPVTSMLFADPEYSLARFLYRLK